MDTGEDKNNYLYFYIFLQKITCSVTLCLLKGNLYFHVPLYSKMAVDWFLVTGGTTVISTLHNYPIDTILFFWSLILYPCRYFPVPFSNYNCNNNFTQSQHVFSNISVYLAALNHFDVTFHQSQKP